MKSKLRYLLVGFGITAICPLMTNAASLTFDGAPTDNSATYTIKYTPDEQPLDTIKLKIDKTNDDLTYELTSEYGTCDASLECTLITTTITTETTLATLTVKNTTADSQKTDITISGDLSGATKSFTLKPGATTTTTKPVELNSSTDLSSLNISVGTMDQAFNKDLTEYNITGIKDTVNSITITPNCDNNCSWAITCPTGECTVSNTRRVNLQTGANKVAVTVTSENGENNKTYVLNVYRGEIETSSAYLSSIKITGSTLSPNFDSMTNDYTAVVGLDVDKLDITTVAEDPSANIVVKGNENLVEGENTITITVTSSDGENKQVYTIIVTKEELEEDKEPEEEDKITTSKVEKKKNNTWLIILLSVLGLGLIIVVFLIIFKKKKKKNKNDKNDKNNDKGSKINDDTEMLEKALEDELLEENPIEKENTQNLNILDETRRRLNEEPKQDIDEALDDLMKTKKLELGDLDF